MAHSPSPLHSRIKLLEFLCIQKNLKPVARMLCSESRLKEHLLFFDEHGVFCKTSSFKVIKTDGTFLYSDSSIRVPLDDARLGHLILYLSKEETKAMQAKDLEEMGRHKELGRILGYPECCCDFFVKHFRADNTDLALDSMQEGEGNASNHTIPWQLNLASRHFDASLLFHFPCSMQCEESLGMAKRHFNVLRQNDTKIAEDVERIMRMPALYTSYEGVFLFPNALIDSSRKTMRFSLPLATRTGKLQYALSDSLCLSWDGKKLFVGSEELPSNSRLILPT